MRTYAALLLAVGLALAACNDTDGPETDGTVVISTSTTGGDPDADGYRLTVDGVESVVLASTDSTEVSASQGRHTFALVGVAGHCSVTPATPIEVNIASGETTPVAFEIHCPGFGVRLTTATGGLDIDSNGYRVVVDGVDQGVISSNGARMIRSDPGSRTIGLTDLALNCSVDGPASRPVMVVSTEAAQVDFAVACTATTGVIGVIVEASGEDVDGVYEARVDGAVPFPVGPDGPTYMSAIPPGDHVVSLIAPANCMQAEPLSVAVTAGTSTRDTAEVVFTAACTLIGEAIVVVVNASGTDVGMVYDVLVDGTEQSESVILDRASGTGRLSLKALAPGEHVVALHPYQANCSVEDSPQSVTVPASGQVQVAFSVTCLPNLATLRITAATTGSIPDSTRFRAMHGQYDYWGYGTDAYTSLGDLEPNGTLIAAAPAEGEGGYPYWHDLWLDDVPATCDVRGETDAEERNGLGSFALRYGDTVRVEFTVACSP